MCLFVVVNVIAHTKDCSIALHAPLAHNVRMIFIETPIFTEDLAALLSDDEYSALQAHLCKDPHAGALIKDTGGLRKVRWAAKGKGKSGGVRVIYYEVTAAEQVRMLLIYPKGEQDSLSDKEKQVLRKLNEGWK